MGMTRVRLILLIATVAMLLALAAVVWTVTCGRGGNASITPTASGSHPQVFMKPHKTVRRQMISPQLSPEDVSDEPKSDISADSASPAELVSRTNVFITDPKERRCEYLARYETDRLAERLKLTDTQRQLGREALDSFRSAALQSYLLDYHTRGIKIDQKIRDLHKQGFADDQIVGQIRPAMVAQYELVYEQYMAMCAAMLRLQPILTPDQVNSLNQEIAHYRDEAESRKKDDTEEETLKEIIEETLNEDNK